MRFSFLFVSAILLLVGCGKTTPAVNPDQNHTHTDFAVWIEGERVDFSDKKYMSGSWTDEEHEGAHHQYLHLHDDVDTVIHRHKPGLSVGDFINSLPAVRYRQNEFLFIDCLGCLHSAGTWQTRLFVNGVEKPEGSAYVFEDLDQIVITSTTDPELLQKELSAVTDDACLYSRTCPERGEPPAENCIADPTVPCVVQ